MFSSVFALVASAVVVPFSIQANATVSTGTRETNVAAETAVAIEVPGLTTETTKVMAQPDGSYKAEISPAPVRVKRDDQWVPVDATLERRPNGTIAPKALPSDLTFSNGGTSPFVRLVDDGKSMAFAWPEALPIPTLDGPTATYVEVLEGVDLVVKASVLGYSTYFVVKSAEAAENPALEQLGFTLQTAGLAVVEDGQGGLEARDQDGRLIFAGPQPRMWDSTPSDVPPNSLRGQSAPDDGAEEVIEEGEGAQSAEIPLDIDGNALTVRPDQELLLGDDTVYPVIVDPSIMKPRSSWGMVWNNGQQWHNDPDEIGRVGYDGWDTGKEKVSRSFYRFDISAVDGKHILSATFRHDQVHSPNFNCELETYGPGVRLFRSKSFDKSIVWPGPASLQDLTVNSKVHGHRDKCDGSTTLEWPIESAVEASDGYLFLGMRSEDETEQNGWRKFSTAVGYPVIEVVYNTLPKKPTELSGDDPPMSCETSLADAPTIDTTTPVFAAKVADSDAPAGGLRLRFYLYQGTQLIWEKQSRVSGGNGARLQAPAVDPGILVNNGVYQIRARTEEATAEGTDVSPFTSYCYFKVDTVPPEAPTIRSEKYWSLGRCTASGGANDCENGLGGVGDPGSFYFKGAIDVHHYHYQLNGGPVVYVPSAGAGVETHTIITPTAWSMNSLRVWAYDGANSLSTAPATYLFKVKKGAAPIGSWKLDELSGSTAEDSSESATPRNAAVSVGGAQSGWWTRGRLGNSVRLDGTDDFLATSGPVVPDTTKSFSVAAWVRLESSAEYGSIVSQVGTNNQAFSLYYSPAYDNYVFGLTSADTASATAGIAAAPGQAAVGVWTHVAGVWDHHAKRVTLYVNGRYASHTDFAGGWKSTGTVQIGRAKRGSATSDYFDGAIDEVHIWNRVVAFREFTDDLHAMVEGTDPDTELATPELVGEWRFEDVTTDGSGRRTASDTSGYLMGAELGVGSTGGSIVQDPKIDRDHGDVLRLNGGPNDFAKTLAPVVDGTGSFTITAWVRATYASRPGPAVVHGDPGTSTTSARDSWWLGLSRKTPLANASYWNFRRKHAETTTTWSALGTTPVEAEPSADWTHVAAVFDSAGREVSLYVNGSPQQTKGDVEAWHYQAPLWFGTELPGVGQLPSFVGDLDDVCAYVGVMEPSEISMQWRTPGQGC